MPLALGTRLGAYEVVGVLGAGGMGEVYRARDAKLNRDVALKVLPAAFTLDPDRLARFKREAQVLASLNHQNIGAIYGFEESFGEQALVLELVDGPTLADRIAQGPIPFDEAQPIARQICEALEAAHEQGVIHRDLKPANIKLRPDGTVKVLDFGLAKMMDTHATPPADSPTLTTPAMTQMGMILGTAAYMSPEQAKGRSADKRSDVWAFGCVLYEMLTGKRAFEGEDVADTLANVLKTDPDWHTFPPDVPPSIRTLLQRCLAKDRRHRAADIAVAQFVLSDPASLATSSAAGASAPASARSKPLWKSALPVAAAIMLTAMVVGLGMWRLRPSSPVAAVTRFSFTLPEGQQLTNVARHTVAVSPDGTQLAHIGNNRLFVRSISEFDSRAIPGTEGEGVLSSPAFSPDGRSIAFHAPSSLAIKRVAVGGGAPVTICSVTPAPFGMSWDSSGILVGQGGNGILRCSPNGGAPERLATVAEGEIAHGPQMLLDGAALLFTIANAADGATRWDKARIVVQSMKSGDRKTVVNGGADARYLPSGHLVYAVGGIVFAVPFDPARQEVIGGAVPVIEGVRRPASATGTAQFATSTTGTLLYLPGPVGMTTTARMLALADRAGTVTRLPVEPGPYVHVRASRDGARLAIGTDDGREAIVSIQELAGTSAMRRLTFGGQNRFPIWSPDGQRVAFQSDREGDLGIFSQRADGNGPVQRLTKAQKGEAHLPESWSPDGTHASFSVLKDSTFSLWMLSIADTKAMPYGGIESREPIGSTFSPDGRWIAYSSTPVTTASGGGISPDRGVYLQPFPATGAKYQIPKQQVDFHPIWGPKAELFYVPSAASGRLAVVSVTTQPGVVFGSPASLPARVTLNRLSGETRAFDILADGRFIGLVDPSQAESSTGMASGQLRVVLNWFEELKQRVPPG
jgi:serine/threonine protein kinase/Tol biopolymer transport system component